MSETIADRGAERLKKRKGKEKEKVKKGKNSCACVAIFGGVCYNRQ